MRSLRPGKTPGPARHVRDLHWLQERVTIDPSTGCWIWRGTCNHKGYGRYHYTTDNGVKTGSAHRLALELRLGRSIRIGLHACHHCDNPPCCNGEHLFEGTVEDNQRDCWTKGRREPIRGEMHGQAKLTEAQVAEILEALKQGEYQRIIANRYGVDQAQISRIKNGRAWL
jgi:hypothetical protein